MTQEKYDTIGTFFWGVIFKHHERQVAENLEREETTVGPKKKTG